MADFGYDVSDYCDVDPIFGTLADFDALVARAHALGVKVIIDQVWRTPATGTLVRGKPGQPRQPRADWYVWHDPKPDGSPPNNWQSVFGGPAWTWDARRRQYYMHNFLKEQPQVNGHHPAVQQAFLDVARFWLERGIDGFRIDAINFMMFDPGFRDNPPAPLDDGIPRTRRSITSSTPTTRATTRSPASSNASALCSTAMTRASRWPRSAAPTAIAR